MPTNIATSTASTATAFSNQKKAVTLSTDRNVVVVGDTATEASFRWSDDGQTWNRYSGSAQSTIDTSAAATATAYSNQRKIDRCQNGVLWTMHATSSQVAYPLRFSYSLDDGVTWATVGATGEDGSHVSMSGSGEGHQVNASFFIDEDDYCHLVYKDKSNGYIYYRRGTPNAGRTAWTWSAAHQVSNASTVNYPDIVAHREGTGWVAHVVASYLSGSTNRTYYTQVQITSGGTVSGEIMGGSSPSALLSPTSYSASVATYPSIDFNHTGDGKTVAGGTPHLYVAWSAGATGAGLGIRFKKATYSAGAWTWGTEREIDNTRMVGTNDSLNCIFDGTRAVMAGWGSDEKLYAHDRDAADTTTTTRSLHGSVPAAEDKAERASVSYDSDGNLYFVGLDRTASPSTKYYKWTRATNTLSAKTTIDASGGNYPSAKRGYSNGRIEFIYTDGTANPYNVVYGGFSPDDGWVPNPNILGWANGSIAAYVDSGGTERLVATWKQSGTGGGRTDGFIYLAVGTFNAGRTTLAWSTPSAVSGPGWDYCDVIAHAEGTGGAAHLVGSYMSSGTTHATVARYQINSSGAQSWGGSLDGLTTFSSAWQYLSTTNYVVSRHLFPTIDYDPITKRLFVSWSAGTTGAGLGIRFRTASYSAGSWTWATEVEVDNTKYQQIPTYGVVCRWDGTRVVIGGSIAGTEAVHAVIWDSTTFTSFTSRISTTLAAQSDMLYGGSMVIDSATGDVYLFGSQWNGSAYADVAYHKASRSGTTLTLGSRIIVDVFVGVAANPPYLNAQYSDGTIHWIYTKGTASPYTVTYDRLDLSITVSGAGNIASAEAHGSPTLVLGGVNIAEAGAIASAESVGTPLLGVGTISLFSPGILSGEVVTEPTIDAGWNVFVSGIESEQSLGSAVVVPGQVTLELSSIISSELWGDIHLTQQQFLLPPGIVSSELVGLSELTTYIVVLPGSIPSAELLDTPRLVLGTVLVNPEGIASVEAFGQTVVQPPSIPWLGGMMSPVGQVSLLQTRRNVRLVRKGGFIVIVRG